MKSLLQVRLLLALTWFFFVLCLEHVKTVKTMLFSLVILAIVVCSLGITVLSLPPAPQPIPITSVWLTTSLQKPQTFTVEQYKQQLTTYLFLSSAQPTHRDVLVNIALLYQAQNNDEKAMSFWNAAKELDPNNALFTQNSNQQIMPSLKQTAHQ